MSADGADVLSVADAARLYRARGWAPLPLKPKGKVPPFDGWQNFVADDSTGFPGNVGVLLGEPSSGLVDVDLDCAEVLLLADALLPPTTALFGRKSKPRSHWIYHCDPTPATQQFQFGRMLVEIRSTGAQTMFPPSLHPSGERVAWASDSAPSKIDANALLAAVSDLAGVALLLRHWPPESGRFNVEGALIGAMLRAGRSIEEVTRLCGLLREHGGEVPRITLDKHVMRSSKRLAENRPVAGLRKLAEYLGADLAATISGWMRLKPARGVDYEPRSDGFYWITRTRETKNKPSGEVRVRLSNFVAEITEVVRRDEGSGIVERLFKVRGARGEIDVPADEFDGMNWVTANWGPHASVVPGPQMKAHLAEAIKTWAGEAEERVVYTHLGWRKMDDAWLFLHAGGAIGANGPVEGYEVDPGGELAHYILPPVHDLKAAVHASLLLLDLGAIGIELAGAVYRAPLNEFHEITFTYYLAGATGTFKSAVTGVALAHFGTRWNGVHFPANWSGTANSLEKIAFLAKDVLLVVDDFAPKGGAYEVEKLHQTADRLLRAQANRGGRGRMNADGSLRVTYAPRGLIAATGEDIPKGQSLRARMIVRHVEMGVIDKAKLSALQQHAAAGTLAEAMSGYVQWIAARAETIGEVLGKRAASLREEHSDGEHARTPDNLVSLMLGIESLLEFAVEVGAIDASEREEKLRRAWTQVSEAVQRQDEEQQGESVAERFREMIRGALAAGRAHLADRSSGGAPSGSEAACGWRAQKYHDQNGSEWTDWRAQGDRLGWIDGDDVYLVPAVAFACAERLCREQGRSLAVTDRTLGRRLGEAGWLVSTDGGDRATKKVRAHDAPDEKSKTTSSYHLAAGVFLDLPEAAAPEADVEEAPYY